MGSGDQGDSSETIKIKKKFEFLVPFDVYLRDCILNYFLSFIFSFRWRLFRGS